MATYSVGLWCRECAHYNPHSSVQTVKCSLFRDYCDSLDFVGVKCKSFQKRENPYCEIDTGGNHEEDCPNKLSVTLNTDNSEFFFRDGSNEYGFSAENNESFSESKNLLRIGKEKDKIIIEISKDLLDIL